MRGFLDGIECFGRGQGRRRRRGQLFVDGCPNVALGQADRKRVRDGPAQLTQRFILKPHPANDRRPRAYLHAARRQALEHALRLQIRVGAGHDLRSGQQPLRKPPILFEPRPGRQVPRPHLRHDPPADLLVDRHRRFVLDVDHALMLPAHAARFNGQAHHAHGWQSVGTPNPTERRPWA